MKYSKQLRQHHLYLKHMPGKVVHVSSGKGA